MTTVIKNVIAPIQAWLLSQGRCVACGSLLSKKGTKIKCKCDRIYIRNSKGQYRRALLTEV